MLQRIKNIILSFVKNKDLRKDIASFIPQLVKFSPKEFKNFLDEFFIEKNLGLEQKQMIIEYLVMNQHIHKG